MCPGPQDFYPKKNRFRITVLRSHTPFVMIIQCKYGTIFLVENLNKLLAALERGAGREESTSQ